MTATYRLRATYLIYITLGIVSTFVLCLNNEKYLKKTKKNTLDYNCQEKKRWNAQVHNRPFVELYGI